MKNLIKSAVVMAKAKFLLSDMQEVSDHHFFKLDQIQTNGADVIIVCIKDSSIVLNALLGDVSIGSNIMDSDEAGNRTLLYSTNWNLAINTDDGRIYIASFVKDGLIDLTDLKTAYFDLPFDEYDNLDEENNVIPE